MVGTGFPDYLEMLQLILFCYVVILLCCDKRIHYISNPYDLSVVKKIS